MIKLKPEVTGISTDSFIEALLKKSIHSDPSFDTLMYLEQPYMNKVGFGKRCPFECPHHKGSVEYKEGLCSNAERVIKRVTCLHVHPGMTNKDMYPIAEAIKSVSEIALSIPPLAQ